MDATAKRILYIEDEVFFGRTLERVFTEDGFAVSLAPDGEAGLALLQQTAFDVVLLDLILPKIDGFEVLKRIKENPETKHIPVVVLSNIGEFNDMKRTKELGAYVHFVKVTTDPRQLVQYIKTLLKSELPQV